MKLFPHILVRLSGDDFTCLNHLTFDATWRLSNNFFDLEAEIQEIKLAFCEKLFNFIPTVKEPEKQNKLLNLKRNIYNNKWKFANDDFKLISSDTEIADLYNQLWEKNSNVKKLKEFIDKNYNEEINTIRSGFKDIIQNEIFNKGLLLSSQSLMHRLKKYSERNFDKISKDDFRTETSLLKYITRFLSKTSPFSTFTSLGIATLSENYNSFLTVKTSSQLTIKSNIRINNNLFLYIKELLYKNKNIRKYFLINPNSTIKIQNGYYHYLFNSKNIEAFQKIPVNPIIDLILEVLQERCNRVVFKDLIEQVLSMEYIDAGYEEMETFIFKLIDYGILEFNLEVSGLDPEWDFKLIEKLERLSKHDALITRLIDTLRTMRALGKEYETSDIRKRIDILSEAFRTFKETAFVLHEAAGLPEHERSELGQEKNIEKDTKKTGESKNINDNIDFQNLEYTKFHFKQEHIFYEDTGINDPIYINKNDILDIAEKMRLLLNKTNFMDAYYKERLMMKEFFLEKYTSSGQIDVLSFYEDYYRNVKNPLAMNKSNDRDGLQTSIDDFISHSVEYIEAKKNVDDFRKNLCNILDQLQTTADAIYINMEHIERCVPISVNKKTVKSSYGAYIQVISANNRKPQAVVNIFTTGFGKMMGRFLHVFDSNQTAEIRKWNLEIHPEAILTENSDASVFNANIHPTLMPYEICVPGGNNNLPLDKQIPISKIAIRYDPSIQELKLYHIDTEKEILIFDLCFQGLESRSNLYQLLSYFTLTRFYFYHFILEEINYRKNIQLSHGITFNKRIVFEEDIILQRKSWTIFKESLPLRFKGEKDSEYFLRLNHWRLQLKIDDEVFIYILSKRETKNEKSLSKKFSADDYKPQYINFRNPLLVTLFEKNLQKVTNYLKIEEMLPQSVNLMNIGGKKFVSEFFFQWYE